METLDIISKFIISKDERLCCALRNGKIIIYNKFSYDLEFKIKNEEIIISIIKLSDINLFVGCHINDKSFC